MEIRNYFENISMDLEETCYASYFMEFADYYGRENIDETAMLQLIYVSLLALEKKSLPKPLVRYIYELRAMGDPRGVQRGSVRGNRRERSLRLELCTLQPGGAPVHLHPHL